MGGGGVYIVMLCGWSLLGVILMSTCQVHANPAGVPNHRLRRQIFNLQSKSQPSKRANLGMPMNCQLDVRNCYDDFVKRFDRRGPISSQEQRARILQQNKLLMRVLTARARQLDRDAVSGLDDVISLRDDVTRSRRDVRFDGHVRSEKHQTRRRKPSDAKLTGITYEEMRNALLSSHHNTLPASP